MFGIVLHLIADWPLQNNWMAANKARRNDRWWTSTPMQYAAGEVAPPPDRWWDRHPAAYVHAGIHGALLALVFGWATLPLAVVHLVIDTRTPVAWWSKLVRQTQPGSLVYERRGRPDAPVYDIGMEVRFWTDQTFHLATIAAAALIVGAA
ncbi:MAG: hypothetical protein ACR2LK_09690 [Solirubrobacteraceae bacterium]